MKTRRDDDVEDVPIPLDRATVERLAKFARATGEHPRDAAAALLSALLIDDEAAHAHDRPAVLHS